MSAIEKLRQLERWTGWHNEGFNERVKNVGDFDKLFDLATKYDLEFVDDDSVIRFVSEDPEQARSFMLEANKALGYNLYNVKATV